MIATRLAALRRARPALPLLALAAFAIGATYIHSASFDPATGASKAGAQLVWLGVALAGFAAALAIPYPRIERHAYAIFAGALVPLAGVFVLGEGDTNGARSWYRFGSVKFQPSEVMKIALILGVAKLLMYRKDLATARGFLAPFFLAAAPIGFIVLQNDLGTVLVFVPAIFAMLFVAGARLRHFGAVAAAVAAALPLAYSFLFREHQRKRIAVFLDPTLDPRGAGFQALQSRIAVGSGGIWGQGWGEGSQTQLHVLPENDTDFIFAVIAEEGGFVTAALLLVILLGLVLACLEVAWRSREPFGRLVATGVAAFFAGQVLVNAGMTIGLVPITGITLPFVSYGGSSLLTCFVALGLVVNVGTQKVPELGSPASGAGPAGGARRDVRPS